MESDSIVAIVTPSGEGGVGIVRVSGPVSVALPLRLFPGVRPPWQSHRMRQGTLVDSATGIFVDQALGCFMAGPHSYTGEDVFEIHCHGSPLVLERVLALCLRGGCRAARPGEFTLRAFLHGRLDLAQAEAVLDVVRARSNAGLELAVQQLAGWLSERIEPMRRDLVGMLARMEALVDFVEDDIPPALDAATAAQLDGALDTIGRLLAGAEQGIVLREGASLAIVGRPNVGKSSIMNALLGLERSIVTPVAGTTRDTIEETVQIDGVPFRTIDTAGITVSANIVERMGVERSCQALNASDVALLVLDNSATWQTDDELVLEALAQRTNARQAEGLPPRLVVTLNKSDLPAVQDADSLAERLQPGLIVTSTVMEPGGVDALRQALARTALGGSRHEWLVGNVRHQDALRRAHDCLEAARDGLITGIPLDLLSLDVRAGIQALGEITGADVDDELLDRIFRDFCIGK